MKPSLHFPTGFIVSFFVLIPLIFLLGCAAQPSPQLDSLQEQVSALRVDIEEIQETREDIKRLGADIDRLNEKLENVSFSPIQKLDESSRLLLSNMANSKAEMQELIDEVSVIKENFNEYSQVIGLSDQREF
jgi:DNA repair exonuclease SbcCD ATPase subunit